MYQKILLAIDGSPTSNAALQEAAKLAGEGTQLQVITIVEDPILVFANPYGVHYDFGALHKAIRQDGLIILEKAQQQLLSLGIKAEMHLVNMHETGSFTIPDTILKYADTCQADLIVLGTHGRRGFKRFFLGSVAEHVIRTATKPVLLVRGTPPATPDSPEKIEQPDDWPTTP